MEDIASKLTELLNNPDIMNQIKNISMSGIIKENSTDKTDDEDHSKKDFNPLDELSPDMLNTMMKLMPILSSMKNDDKYTSFLHSLRPLLSESRQKKLDESFKIIKLVSVFPLLKNNGII